MEVKCKNNRGSYPLLVLPINNTQEADIDNYVSSNEWYTIDADVSGYCLTIGKQYTVYGVMKSQDKTRFLVLNDQGIPYFMPSDLFMNANVTMCWDWEERCFCVNDINYSIIASNELISSYEDLVCLVALDEKAIRRFLEYKRFIEDYFV